ncbi:MAG: hypothetical protein GY757_56760 [bacterium]|nr:hypothetical protein [bacterium]
MEQVLRLTGGQPFLTQLICHTVVVVSLLNEEAKSNYAVIDDVDAAVDKIITGGSDHFSRHIWDSTDATGRFILSAAAEEITRKQLDAIDADSIFERVIPLFRGFNRRVGMKALENLVTGEILEENNLRYRFPVNVLRKWIAQKYPLRKVREFEKEKR